MYTVFDNNMIIIATDSPKNLQTFSKCYLSACSLCSAQKACLLAMLALCLMLLPSYLQRFPNLQEFTNNNISFNELLHPYACIEQHSVHSKCFVVLYIACLYFQSITRFLLENNYLHLKAESLNSYRYVAIHMHSVNACCSYYEY